jgi:hypothetical protein
MGQKKHWNKFKHAARDIAQQEQYFVHPDVKMVCAGTAALINSKVPKFYIPNADGLLSEKDMPLKGEMFNLPYPIVCILSETKMLSRLSAENTIVPSNEDTWVLTVAIQEKTNGPINLMSTTYNGNLWTFSPISVRMCPGDGNQPFGLGIVMTDATKEMIKLLKEKTAELNIALQESVETTTLKDFVVDANNVCVLCSLLNVHDTKTIKVPMPAVLKRTPRKGKTAPDYDYHVLSVGGEVWDSPWLTENNGEGGVRSHLRRGHIRRLKDRSVWVRSTVVHGSREGFVNKDYEVKGTSNAVREQTPSV